MRKLAKKRDSAKDAADYGAPRPFHHNAGPITGGLVSRPRPGLSDRSRSGDARRALAVAKDVAELEDSFGTEREHPLQSELRRGDEEARFGRTFEGGQIGRAHV